MRWELISTGSSGDLYELWHKDTHLLSLTYNPSIGSARIECCDEKRTFIIRKEGFLKSKTVVRNEYGVKIGQLGHENHQDFIELDNEKFYYTFTNSPLAGIVFYKETKEQPYIVCKLTTPGGKPSVQFSPNTSAKTNLDSLLMALCWFMFMPVAKENVAEYAA
ncbi:MAG TPA: hypothetical protein VFS36_01620 [Chitinophagaceae bacterium]|jgi:hypothetical protein|nr:hypothetical protein [Chitinophagaceae bacterium]